jgi:hypothetical protein
VDVSNALTGEPRAVDVDFDGNTDRVYFGDLEGRMWKACDFGEHGEIGAVKLFFDPALYDNPNGTSPGYPDTPGTDGGDTTPLGGAAATDALQRQQLRGPIYFPADVTHDGTGGILVAFGSGNIMDLLTPPAAYKNMLWVVRDDTLPASCTPPAASSCTGNTGLNTVTITTPSSRTFDDVLLIDELLTGAPQILSGFLVYPEFKRTSSSTCSGASYLSRVVARDVFNCGSPSTSAFTDPVTNTPNVITYTDTLVTGLQVDPSSGTLFIQTSTGTAPPNAVNAPGLQSETANIGFRQMY